MTELKMMNYHDLKAYVAAAGLHMEQIAPQITDEMRDILAERVDGLNQDTQLLEMLRASINGNVTTLCHILRNDIGVDSLHPSTGAVEYAVRLAHRDVPLVSLTRAYYLGQALLIRRGMDAVVSLQIPDMETQMAVARTVIDVTHNYIDWILKYVSEVHESERRKWWATRAVTGAAAVRRVLRGERVSLDAFEKEMKYGLEQTHLAVIAWLEYGSDDPEDQRRIDMLIRRIAVGLNSIRPPLITASDKSTAWGWIGVTDLPLEEELRSRIDTLFSSHEARNIRLALGTPGEGIEGFIRSHEQAEKARLVALGAPYYKEDQSVQFDPNVALASLLMHDVAGAMSWTDDVLGDIVKPGESNAALRDTLATFYLSGENYTRTAEILGLHRNTVRQRVAKFEAGRAAQHSDPLEISLALRLHELLGDRADD